MEVSSNWKKYMEVAKADTDQTCSGKNRRSTQARGTKNQKSNSKDKRNSMSPRSQHAQLRQRLTKAVALDCEMVGIQDGVESMLARVSIVNSYGDTLYDTFVKPTEPVVDYRTSVSGVRPRDLENGVEFQVVQKYVADTIKGHILVGHDLKNDLRVLFLSHPRRKIRDTSRFGPFREISNGRTPSLKKLANDVLGIKLQSGEHSSVEDAKAAMQLYNLYKKEWERSLS